jgi:hypothetical protein
MVLPLNWTKIAMEMNRKNRNTTPMDTAHCFSTKIPKTHWSEYNRINL